MRRNPLPLLVAAAFVAGLSTLALVAPGAGSTGLQAAVAGPDATPAANLSPCTGTITATLSADQVRLCDEVAVQVPVAPICALCPNGVNVVFVQIDKAFEAPWMDEAATQALDALMRYEDTWDIKVGVVHYNRNVVVRKLDMTDSIARARGPLNEPPVGHDPFGDVEGAAREALRMLREERETDADDDGDRSCELIIFFASTKNIFTEQGQKMRSAANMIHREKVELLVGCPERNADYCTFTKEMPRTMRNYTEAFEMGRLRNRTKEHIEALDEDFRINSFDIVQTLEAGLAYVPGSAQPEPDKVISNTEGAELSWHWGRMPIQRLEPLTITYKARPKAEGTWKIAGRTRLVDSDRRVREVELPAFPVTVAGDCTVPTATPVPTDTPTATATATATATPVPGPIYLPLLLREECTLKWVFSDVALVLDLSTSMNRPTGASRTKLAAAQEAAKSFLDLMTFGANAEGQHDQVAVVGVNREAWIAQGLSNDPGVLKAAIDGLVERQQQHTRLDLAFERGAEALADDLRLPGNTPVLVLLTDGLPNQVPYADDGTMETTVRRAAGGAKEAGIRIYTIGLGNDQDINGALLAECASDPSLYFTTPDAEHLAAIYSQIAYSFGCPRGRHKWGEPWP